MQLLNTQPARDRRTVKPPTLLDVEKLYDKNSQDAVKDRILVTVHSTLWKLVIQSKLQRKKQLSRDCLGEQDQALG